MKISEFSVKHSAVVAIVLIALILFGIFSITSTNMEFMGDISLPQVFVIVVYPGASAEDIEDTVISVIEDDFVTIQDFKSMTSSASNSVGSVVVTFQDGIDPYSKINDIRNELDDLMDDLPDGIMQPQVVVGGASMLPIVTFSIEGGEDIGAVSDWAKEVLKPQLTQIEGVSEITISGTAEPRVNIVLSLDDMDAKGISPLTVYQILSASNVSLPLGTTEYAGRDISVRYDGKFSSVEDIENLPVGASDDGSIIYLRDVANVSLDYENSEYYITQDGKSVILVEICKRSDGNTIAITNSVKDILEKNERDLGGALKFNMISDDATLVLSSLKTVITSGISGVLIAIVVIFLFLSDPKATLIIGLSIPLSIFFAFLGMKLAGISINLMSISGITVALGSIVDASIVVLDQVYRYYQSKKDDGTYYSVTESIYKGSNIVGASVLGSNLTTVVVFIPLALLSGIVGSILHDVSITFMISILASLIVAIIFVPWLLKHFLKEDGKRAPKRESPIMKVLNKVEYGYNKALGFTIAHPSYILAIAVGVLLITVYTLPQMKMAFIPSTDNNDFYVNISFPYGYKLDDTHSGMLKAEEVMKSVIPEEAIDTYAVFSGRSTDVFTFSDASNQGGMHIVLVSVKERDFDIHDAITSLQYELQAALPDATISVTNGGFDRLVGYVSGGGGYGIKLIGEDESQLYQAALEIESVLLADPEVVTASIDANYDDTNAVIKASNDYLSSLGLTSYEAGMTTAILFNGMDIGIFSDPERSERYDIHLSSNITDYPINESTLSMIKLTTQMGSKVSFPSISELVMENSLSQVNHTDRAKTITVSANLTGESTTNVSNRVNDYLKMHPLPSGVTTATGGIGELIEDAVGPIVMALLIAVFLVYFVMVIIFERFKQPFLVMLTVPFCVIGVTLSLAIFGSSLNLVSIMGVISLAGMLVNNGIIMVDYINQLEDEERRMRLENLGVDISLKTKKELFGLLDRETEMEMLKRNTQNGTSTRLRPILMSSLTTILGVIPMAVATGEGAEVYAPLGQVIMGGLTTSMLITLFVMPVFYYISERGKIRRFYRKKAKADMKKEKIESEKNDK